MNARGFAVTGILGVSLMSGGWLLGRGLNGRETSFSGNQLFSSVQAHIKQHYVDSVSDSALFEKAMLGMLSELQDPYTLYLPPARLRRITETTTGNYVGIGAQVQKRDNWPMVVAPFPGSPAERAGLHIGDRIVEIDGKRTRGWAVEETTRALRGVEGTVVRLVIERPGSPRPLTFALTRGGVHRRAVAQSIMLPQQVGFVTVANFNDSTERELQQAVDSLHAIGMRSLILDLRRNPGGVLTQGVSVAGMFLTKGQPIVTMRGRAGDKNQEFVATSSERWPNLPLVVLIDEASASASEIVAGALQDHDRAVLVGRTSFGKGSAQTVYSVLSGGAVKLTTGRWYTPSGRSIDRPRGVAADADDPELDAPERKAFRTDNGRTVYGGGGIVPDITVGDTSLAPSEKALEDALGSRVIDFRDAMTAYAIQLRTQEVVKSPDFVVTPSMLDGLWTTMRSRGFTFERRVFDEASGIVSRLLGREIAQYVFGSVAAAERKAREDEIVQVALRLASNAKSTAELLELARRYEGSTPK